MRLFSGSALRRAGGDARPSFKLSCSDSPLLQLFDFVNCAFRLDFKVSIFICDFFLLLFVPNKVICFKNISDSFKFL